MFTKFWKRYPQGSLTSEFVSVDRGQYIVRALIQVNQQSIASGFGMANSLEEAEDKARHRALEILDLETTAISNSETPVVASAAAETLHSTPSETASIVPEKVKPPSPAVSPPLSDISVSHEKDNAVTVSADNGTQNSVFSTVNQTQEVNTKPATTPYTNQSNLFNDTSETATVATPEPATETTVNGTPNAEPQEDSTVGISQAELMEKTALEVRRLHWTGPQGKQYLLQTYGQSSRSLLTNEQLLEFLQYLQAQPSPNTETTETSPQEDVEDYSETMTEETPASGKELPVVNGEIDVVDLLSKTKAEMNRLGWTKEDEKEHLLKTYGKRSRQYLGDGEFLDFLEYLQQLPNK